MKGCWYCSEMSSWRTMDIEMMRTCSCFAALQYTAVPSLLSLLPDWLLARLSSVVHHTTALFLKEPHSCRFRVCGGRQNNILWKVIISLPSRLNPNSFKPWENWLAALIWRGESGVGFSYTVCSPQALFMPKKATWRWKLSHSISIRGPVVQLWPIWTTTFTARLSAVWSWALLSELCLAVVAASYTRWEVILNEAEETAG